MHLHRRALTYLSQWLDSSDRKPIIIRGARQVGKTWLTRQLATTHGLRLIELNFERTPEFKSLFNSNDPQKILVNIESVTNQSIDPENSLLFLDEIQSAPQLLSKLRWFAEELPVLPVVAAGSLLEFTLDDFHYSMPVGRINYMYLEPLSFEEFLLAKDQAKLYEWLTSIHLSDSIPQLIHQRLLELCREYIIVGGLPAAVSSWVSHPSLSKINEIQHNLLATYREDFTKYATKTPSARLNDVLLAIPNMLGQKFIYSHVTHDDKSSAIKQALDLLIKARLCHKITASSANGIPLGAQTKDKFFKVILLDVGLVSALQDLRLTEPMPLEEIKLINQGGISEQFVGQSLRCLEPFYIDPSLYYWTRQYKGGSSEIDYILQHNNDIIPIEVKSGSTGSLKSLHLFMAQKKLERAIRINADLPSVVTVDMQTPTQKTAHYQLLSLPLYMVGQLHRLLNLKG